MEWTVAIGVDTHKEMHVAVALDAFGAQLDSQEIPTTPAGYRGCSPGRRSSASRPSRSRARAATAPGSFASSSEPASRCTSASVRAVRSDGAGRMISIDAALAARRLLAGEGLSLPRGGGRREDLRLLLLERRGAMQARNAALNQLSALLVTAPEHVRERLGGLSGERLAQAAARLRPRPDVMTGVLRRLGKRAERLSKEVADAERALASCSPRWRPTCSRSAA